MLCASCWRRKRARRSQQPALEPDIWLTDRITESSVYEAGEEHSEGVWMFHDGQVTTVQTPRQRARLQSCRAATRPALLESPAAECAATALPPSALLFTKDADCPTAVERRRTDQEDEISRHGPAARSSRSGFTCSSCGREQPSRLHLNAAASGEFVRTPGLPPLVKVTVLVYDSRLVPKQVATEPDVHSIRLDDRNPFPGSKLSVRVRLPWDIRMRHHEDEHGNHLLPVVQYFDTFSLLSCPRCLEKDQSPPSIHHWLLEPLPGYDPGDRVNLALDFSYIRASNPPSGFSEKETVDNVTTFLLTVKDKRDGRCAEDRSGWRNRLQSLSIAQLLEVARALDIAERDLRSIQKSRNEDLRKDLVEMCMTHGSTHTGVFITALAKLDPESSVARTPTYPTQATDYEESASVPVPSAHPELPHPELPEGEGEDSCTAPKKGMGSASEDGQDFVRDFVREHTLQNGTFSKSGYYGDAVWFPRSGEYHRGEFVTLHNSEAVPDLASGGAFCADKSSVSDYPFSHSGNSRSQSGECSATMQNSLSSSVQETRMRDILNCDLDGTSLSRNVTQTGMCFSTMDAESMRSSSMNYSTDDGVSSLPKRRKAHDASVEWTCRVAKDPVEHELMHEDSVGCIVADSLDRQSRKQFPESPADLCHLSSTTARGQPSVKELSVTRNPRSGRFCNSPPPSAGRAPKASADPTNQSPAATHYGNQQKESLLIACQTATKASDFSRAELGTSKGDYGIPCATSVRAPLGTGAGRSNAVPHRKGQFFFSASNARQNLAGDITVGTTASWTPRNPPPNLRRVHVSEDEESNPKRKYRPPDSAAAAASVATLRSPASSLSQTSSLSRPGPCPQSDHLDGDDSLTSLCRSLPEQEDRSAIREGRGESVASAVRSMSFSYISSSFGSSGSGLSTARFSVANPSTVTDADVPASVDVALAESYLQLLRQGGADTRFNNLASDSGSNLASVSSSVRLDFALSLGSQVSSSSSFSSFLSSSLSPPPSAVVDCRSPHSVGFVRLPILCLKKDASVPAENLTAVNRETSVTQTQTNPQEAGTPPPIVSRHWQGSRIITSTGHTWRQPGSDVILHVPAGAVERERPVRVNVAICADVDHIRGMLMLQEEEEEEEKIVSPLAEYCVEGAPNFHFPSPVRLTLPHALPKEVDVDQVHVHRVSRGQDGSVVVTRLRNSAGTSPAAAGGSVAAAADGGGDNDGQGHQAEFPCFHLTSNGELHVVTDCFSGYVCSYNNCGLRQESPVLVAMVCGSYMREGRNQWVIIRTHVWDERLNIRDFQKENRIDASDQILPKEVLPLLDEVHNSKLWLRLLWDDKYWTLADHLLCLEVQTIEMRQVLSCNNDNCHARKVCSRPVSISWALLTPADCPPEVTRTLLCSVLLAHAPVDAPPSWSSQDGNIKRLLFSIGDTAILSPPDHRARQVGTMGHHWDSLYSLRQGKAVADWLDGVMTSGDALTSPSGRCPDTAGLPPGVANRDDDDNNDDDSVTSNGQSPRSSAYTTKSTDPAVGRGRSYNNNKHYAPSVLGSSGHCGSTLRGSCYNACTALRSSASGGTASEAGTATSGVLDPNSIYNQTQLTKTTIERQFEAELIVADNDDSAGAPRGFSTNGSCCVDGTEAESWQPRRSGGRGNQNTRQSSSASEHDTDQLRDPEPLHDPDPRHDLDQRSGLDQRRDPHQRRDPAQRRDLDPHRDLDPRPDPDPRRDLHQRRDPDPRRDLEQLRDPLSQLGSPGVTEDSATACPEDGRAAGSGRRGNGGKVKRSFASRRRRPKSDKTEQKCTIL